MNNFRCDCPEGYLGKTCANATNECSTSPCKNGATCQDLHRDYNVRVKIQLPVVRTLTEAPPEGGGGGGGGGGGSMFPCSQQNFPCVPLFPVLAFPYVFLGLCLHGTGLEPFHTEPDRIGFCLRGTVLEPVRNGSKQIQNWTYRKVGPVLDPFRTGFQNGLM